MSYNQDSRRRRLGPSGTGFSSSGTRTVWGYWVPLALTVGIATVSIAAWIWSERNEGDGDDNPQYPPGPAGPAGPPPPGYPPSAEYSTGEIPPGAAEYSRSTAAESRQDDGSVIARMQGALRRTPSPQQILDGASRKVAAGMAAAGAMVGGALSSIREEQRGDYEDHSRWSEEAEARARGMVQGPPPGGVFDKKRKTVAIVVSAVPLLSEIDDPSIEHASILSHLPSHVDSNVARVFVLIYAPALKHAPGVNTSTRPTSSVASSYSNIAHEDAAGADAPGTDMATLEPHPADELEGSTPLFKTLYTQAQAVVDKDSMIMPFSTPNGHVHILRHLSPDIVYIQVSLAGDEGAAVQQISGWVRHVVVVVGDEGGRGGLIDSDDESALAGTGQKWWQKEGVTGIGKRIDVVDGLRTGDDWRRRVSGHD